MRKALEIGGFVAAAVLIVFGVVAIAMGMNGRSTVQDSLRAEQIVGSADMTPAAIKDEAMKAGLRPRSSCRPSMSPARRSTPARAPARSRTYIRIHSLEATGGLTYSQLPRFSTADGKGTSDAALALKDAKGQPVANPLRDTMITATALETALNTSYMAEQLALFGIVVGIALLLSGIGFAVLAVGGTLRNPDPALKIFGRKSRRPPEPLPFRRSKHQRISPWPGRLRAARFFCGPVSVRKTAPSSRRFSPRSCRAGPAFAGDVAAAPGGRRTTPGRGALGAGCWNATQSDG